MEKFITQEQALEALENMNDCARMDVGVYPYGPYIVLKEFIEQNQFEVVGWRHPELSKPGQSVTFSEKNKNTCPELYPQELFVRVVKDSTEKKLIDKAVKIVEKHYPEKGQVQFVWAINAVLEALKSSQSNK